MKFEEYVGKTVFVTGAASGIGQAQAIAFLENGANVFAFDLDERGYYLYVTISKTFAYCLGSVCRKGDVEKQLKKRWQHLNKWIFYSIPQVF